MEKVVSCVCVRKGRGGGYQSCCQSAGQVVIREVVWQPVGIYLCLRLSTSHTHTHIHSLKRWRKTLLCSPLPPLSEHSAGVPGRGAELLRQPFVQHILRMTEGIQMARPGEERGEFGLHCCRSECYISAAAVLKQAATPNRTASWDFFDLGWVLSPVRIYDSWLQLQRLDKLQLSTVYRM